MRKEIYQGVREIYQSISKEEEATARLNKDLCITYIFNHNRTFRCKLKTL